jgi:hypothetical protein
MSNSRGKKSKSKPTITLKKRKARAVKRVLAIIETPPLPQGMHFVAVEDGSPEEGDLVLVRLKNDVYRYGMVVGGQFAAHDYHSDQFVTFAHPDWITHWLKIIPPVALSPAKAEAETAQPEFLPPEHVESLEDVGQHQA